MAKLLEWSADEASGDALDYSGNGRNLTISAGNLTTRATGHTSTGLQQISTGISSADATGLNTATRTTMFWLRVNAAWTGWIMELYSTANGTGAWGLLYLSGTLQWRAKNPSNTSFPVTITPDAGVWHHIAATYDGTKMWVYRDGVLLNAGGTTISGGIMTGDAFRVFESVGSAAIIDDVRVFDTALSQSQITTQMNTPAGPSSTPNQGTLDGSFSSPVAGISGELVAQGQVAGTFSSPAAGVSGESVAIGGLAAALSTPTVDLSGSALATGALDGSFSAPTFAATGGVPMPDRDILVTIGPGERPSTVIEELGSRTSIAEGAARTQIGAGNMDKQWRNGSEQFVDFVMTLKDPEGELTLAEVQNFGYQVLVQAGTSTPPRDSASWTAPSVMPKVEAVGPDFKVTILHMHEAVTTGLHTVWVKFGPTPENPIYLAASFVVL